VKGGALAPATGSVAGILRFVKEFGQREGYSPSYREIAEELGLAVSTFSYHVSVLKQDGSLRRGPGQPRTIVEPASPATQAEGDEVEVPLIGQIAAGTPWTPWSWPRRPSCCPGVWSAAAHCSCCGSRETR
jgi:SOS-response transcriptional repressor LexA